MKIDNDIICDNCRGFIARIPSNTAEYIMLIPMDHKASSIKHFCNMKCLAEWVTKNQ